MINDAQVSPPAQPPHSLTPSQDSRHAHRRSRWILPAALARASKNEPLSALLRHPSSSDSRRQSPHPESPGRRHPCSLMFSTRYSHSFWHLAHPHRATTHMCIRTWRAPSGLDSLVGVTRDATATLAALRLYTCHLHSRYSHSASNILRNAALRP